MLGCGKAQAEQRIPTGTMADFQSFGETTTLSINVLWKLSENHTFLKIWGVYMGWYFHRGEFTDFTNEMLAESKGLPKYLFLIEVLSDAVNETFGIP